MKVGGIILGGGKSSRFGSKINKCLIKLGFPEESKKEKSFLELVYDKLRLLCEEVLLVARDVSQYPSVSLKVIEDEVEGYGPLVGILSGLRNSTLDYNIVVACDTPFLNSQLLEYLIEEARGYDIAVPFLEGGLEPLQAVYSKSCLKFMEESIREKKHEVISFFDKVSVNYVKENAVRRYDPELLSFFNINTFGDLKRAQKLSKKR